MTPPPRRQPVIDRLRRLDDRVVPVAAARLRAGMRAYAGARSRVRAPASAVGHDTRGVPVAERSAGPLTRLDGRLASSGPLAALRAVPQAGAVVAAALLLLGAVAAVSLRQSADDRLLTAGGSPVPATVDETLAGSGDAVGPDGRGDPLGPDDTGDGGQGQTPADPVSTVLGPGPGIPAADHLAAAAAELAALTEEAPASAVPALVHLAGPATPAEVAGLVPGVQPLRAVVRVPVPGEQSSVATLPALRLPDDLVTGLTDRAAELRSLALADEAAAAGAPAGDPTAEVLGRAARVARAEAEQLDTGPACACVVGLLVSGTPGELSGVAGLPGVRGVDPGPAGVPPEQLTLLPLPPEEAGPGAAGGAAGAAPQTAVPPAP